MRQSGSSAVRSAGLRLARRGIESKGTAGWIATAGDCIVARMKNRLPVIVAGIVAVALIGFVMYRVVKPQQQQAPAPQTASTQPASSEDTEETARRNVPRVEPDELLGEFKAGSVTIIDVRDADSFQSGHIPGAKHIPLAQVESSVPYLPKAKPIVAYCT